MVGAGASGRPPLVMTVRVRRTAARGPPPLIFRCCPCQIEHQLDRFVGRNVSEERIVQFAQLIERFHEHIRVRDLTRQEVMQCLLSALIVACFDQRLIRLTCPGFGGDIRPQIPYDIAALLNVCGCLAASLTVEEVRASAFDLEQRSVV